MEFEKHSGLAVSVFQYIIKTRPLHDRLQQVLTQVAGFSLLVMSRGGRAPMLDGPLALARDTFRSTREQLRALRAPTGAVHHYHHLIEAAGAVEQAIDVLTACLRPQADEPMRTDLVRRLRFATDHLRAAARLLPGFEMVDLSQACCAVHGDVGPMVCS